MEKIAVKNQLEISEVFSSIQGEGLHMGERHIFVRLKRCNLKCIHCDEQEKPCNTVTSHELIDKIREVDEKEGPHSFVSLTGGEPLIYGEAVAFLAKMIKGRGYKIYLETNGTLPKEFALLRDRVSVVAMDIKLPSISETPPMWNKHKRFLEMTGGLETFVKIVISLNLKFDEFEKAVSIISSFSKSIPLILQPEDSVFFSDNRKDLILLLRDLQRVALRKLTNVRILPRLHKVLGVR